MTAHVKQVGEHSLRYEPANEEESSLVTKVFETITELQPELNMGDRTDLAMRVFADFKQWAHAEDMTNPLREGDTVVIEGGESWMKQN